MYQKKDNTTFQVVKWEGNPRAQYPTEQHLAVKTQAYADFFYFHIKDPILSLEVTQNYKVKRHPVSKQQQPFRKFLQAVKADAGMNRSIYLAPKPTDPIQHFHPCPWALHLMALFHTHQQTRQFLIQNLSILHKHRDSWLGYKRQ